MERGTDKDAATKGDGVGNESLSPYASSVKGATANDTQPTAAEESAKGTVTAGKEANIASFVKLSSVPYTHADGPSNASIAGSTSSKTADQGASNDKGKPAGEDETTPRASQVESVTPTSSSKRYSLRRASLSGSPSAAKGLGSPSLGFGAGLRNVPAPIATQAQSIVRRPILPVAIREPIPEGSLPGIDEQLGQYVAAQANQKTKQDSQPRPPMAPKQNTLRRASVPKSAAQAPPRVKPAPSSQQMNSYIKNPYVRRADVIGPRHGLPGIGHLGDQLTPPGWVPGNDPITPAQAMRLYQEARARATASLNYAVRTNPQDASAKEHEDHNAGWQTTWENQLKLDQILYAERRKVYEAWHENKTRVTQGQQSSLQRQHRPDFLPPSHLQPHDPPTGTSAHAYTQYQQAQLHTSPHAFSPNPPLSGGAASTHNRLQELQRRIHFPLRSPMSPGTLDPSLVPETLQSVYSHYYQNRSVILEMQQENEVFLATWCAKFRAPLPHSPGGFYPSQPAKEHIVQPPTTVQRSYTPYPPVGQDRTQTSFQRARADPMHFKYSGAPNSQPYQHVPRLSQGDSEHGYHRALSAPLNRTIHYPPGNNRENSLAELVNAPSGVQIYPHQAYIREAPRPSNLSGSPSDETHVTTDRKHSEVDPPKPSNPNAAQVSHIGGTKSRTWYHNAMSEADLPTSVITQQAMQAGVDSGPAGHKQQNPSKPKPRNTKKPTTKQQRGFKVPSDVADRFLKMGAIDATGPVSNGPPGFSVSTTMQKDHLRSDTLQPTNGATQPYGSNSNCATHLHTAYPPNATSSQVSTLPSYVSQYQAAGVEQPQSLVQSTQEKDDTISAPNSAALSVPSTQPSSDAPDDPKDLTFGTKVRQRKIPASRTTAAARKPSEGTKRRNSKPTDVVAEASKKRARHGLDGAADEEGPVWTHSGLLHHAV